ncbi:MAG: Ku protein [Betaproteobacteria bacterium]
MARALWNGYIAFGLVNVPVDLYPAEQKKGLSFSMLDKRDMSPVGYKRYSKRSGNEVESADIVKGYEYEKEQYVVMSPEDFRRANVKASQTVEIKAFVPASEIPLQYFETPYYLAPTKRGEKVYALLRETLRSTGRVAIAQVVIRTTQHLAAVVVDGPKLVMITLRYADEIRDARELTFPPEGLKEAGVTAKEIELAKRLIEDMSETWNPAEFRDTYRDDLMKLIDEKIRLGETAVITKDESESPTPASAEVIDLAELLRKSLAGGRKASNDDSAVEPRRAAKGVRPATRSKAAPEEPKAEVPKADKPITRRKRA